MARPYDDALELMARGVAKVVEAADVEMLTRQGWRIAKILPETGVAMMSESVPFMAPGMSYPTSGSGTRAVPVSTTRFLMFEDEKSQLAKMAQLAAVHEVTMREQRERLAAADKALKEQAAAYAKMCEQERATATTLSLRGAEVFDIRKQRDLMERDIAKIRKAVGELRMKEILEAP